MLALAIIHATELGRNQRIAVLKGIVAYSRGLDIEPAEDSVVQSRYVDCQHASTLVLDMLELVWAGWPAAKLSLYGVTCCDGCPQGQNISAHVHVSQSEITRVHIYIKTYAHCDMPELICCRARAVQDPMEAADVELSSFHAFSKDDEDCCVLCKLTHLVPKQGSSLVEA